MVGETTAKAVFKAEDIALKLIELGALSANVAYLEMVKQKSLKKAAENLRAKQARAKELEKVQADAEVFTKQVQEMVKNNVS